MSGKKGLSRVQSDETLTAPCDPIKVPEKDPEQIFSAALLPPLFLTVGYITVIYKMYKDMNEEIINDPASDPVRNIWIEAPIFATVAYLAMVYFGQKIMATRETFEIKPYIFTYNLYQCLLNLWTVYAMYEEVTSNPWFTGFWGVPPQAGPKGFRISSLVWLHYVNKYMELLDTVWMILRKKNNQVSFLHCYHHVLLIWAWFVVCRIESGGDAYFGASVNSLIHVLMYGYYTLALIGVPCPWKKWITNCQMAQFCLCILHASYVMWKGHLPIVLPLSQIFVMVNMLVLFGNFMAKTYKKKVDSSDKKK